MFFAKNFRTAAKSAILRKNAEKKATISANILLHK